MSEILTGTLPEQGLEVLLDIQRNEQQYHARLDSLKTQIQGIAKAYRKRVDTIERNGDRFDAGKIVDLLFDARESTRHTLQELVNTRGWKKEIAACLVELESFEAGSEIKQLQQTILEVEARKFIVDGKVDVLVLQGLVESGDPLWVQAVATAPIPLGITDEILETGKKYRLERLKPIIAARYHSLLKVQGNLEAAASLFMPVKLGDVDPIRDILAE